MVAVKKKNTRVKTGLVGAPINKGFVAFDAYFNYDLSKKDYVDIVKSYVKDNYSKEDAQYILANPEYTYASFSGVASAIYWRILGQEFPENYAHYPQFIDKFFSTLIESGKKIQPPSITNNVIQLSPHQHLLKKISDTVLADLEEMEEDWINGKKTTVNLYERFKVHGLKSQAVETVRSWIEPWLQEYKDCYDKTCEQAVEAYSHLTRIEIKRRIDVLRSMVEDLEKIKSATKATRTTRARKPKAVDKQVARVKYQKEDNIYKLVSIDPIKLVSSHRLYTFNTKTRRLTYYFTDATNGFEISGTSIKNFDIEASNTITLRANTVGDILKVVLTKSQTQISKTLEAIKTKPSTPNGRLNEDTILLRVI